MLNNTLKNILLARHYLVHYAPVGSEKLEYLNAYLLANFGIVVDKPALLTKSMVEQIDQLFHLNVPKSFYNNPQDTKYFTCDELLIEQIVSYFAYGSELGRIELFKKDLPDYVVGDELKLRTFYIVNELEAADILRDTYDSYCAYTRPFSLDELSEFVALFEEGFTTDSEIKCKENIFTLLGFDKSFARFLDKKDIVKLSIQKFGDRASFNCSTEAMSTLLKQNVQEIAQYIPYVKNCPMSKKQAKYFNKIVAISGMTVPRSTNEQSPDKRALKLLSTGDVVGAARIYASSGSMLERRIRMLLSRANPKEAVEILNMMPAANPIVLYQLMTTLSKDDTAARTFTFFHNNKVRVHHETAYEAQYRKSRLNESTCEFLAEICLEKIKEYYRSLPSFGKVYVADNFYKLGLPTNTSASGKGIDILPIGSRMPVNGDKVRTFVHWKDAFDIDSSLIIVNEDDTLSTIGWFNYGRKQYGNNVLFSGDITGPDGAEYFDIDLDALAARGCKYVVQTFHGYCSKLNSGEIYAGYQNKENFNTRAWDPKNIEMQFKVFGDSRACIAFAIDINTREVIILNQIIEDDDRVVRPDGFKTIEKYLQSDYLAVNIGLIAACRGELAETPMDANVVLDDDYVPVACEEIGDEIDPVEQTVIRSWELEKLVALINN